MKKLLVALLTASVLAGCSRIDTGNTGVEATFGQVKEQTLPPGVYFSLFKTIYEVNTMEFGLEINDMSPKAKDNVTLTDVDLTVYFRVDPKNVAKIMTRYAGDMKWNSKTDSYIVGHDLVARMAREAIYNAFTKYNASEMHLRRAELASAIRENLQRETDNDAGKGMFDITNVLVRNIVTDPRLEEAIKQGFSETGKVPDDIKALLGDGKLGEAILTTMLRFQTGAAGEPTALQGALAAFRALGLEETARRSALEVQLLRRGI
ncbi:MAG: hypothetical protein EBS68_14385 [Rhodobacteraceae bacterium]|nr:hypothetical protein [Paracoccaceae bacterium]